MNTTYNKRTPVLLIAVVLSILLTGFVSSVRAQGGPPMITDDPGTPGNGMWEVNFLSTVERSRSGWFFETPIADINYGVGSRIQLKFEVPLVVSKESGENTKFGLGNSKFGVKYRFLDEEKNGVDMSIYPQLEFNNPTRSVERGLAERGMVLVLPLEIVKKVGPVEVNPEVGYEMTQFGTDTVFYGVAVGRQISKRMELAAEIHGDSLRTFKETELLVNFGTRLKLNDKVGLMFSAGRTIHTPTGEGPHFIAALGIQFNFKGKVF
jgi:hypothetical protein